MDEYDMRHFQFTRQSGIPRGQLGDTPRHVGVCKRIFEGLALLALGLLFYIAVNLS